MKKKIIIIPVETKSREFHGKLFLALHLLSKGYTVLFGDQVRLWNYCDLLEPAVYLDKSVAATRVEWFRQCRTMGHEVVSWDEEGVVFFNSWMYRKLRIEPEAFDQVRRFFAWGGMQQQAICEEFPQYSEKISVCGNPRFDFLRPEFRSFYEKKMETLKKRFGRIILINTNFAFYNHYKSPEELHSMLAHYPLADEPGYLDGWIAMHRKAHEAYIKMVPELLSRYPEHTVILRPHPSEDHTPWERLASDHKRLIVDSSGNVHEWILASEAVIHFNCTTAVESYLLSVPPIAYRPGRFPQYENPLPYALSENTFSLNELWIALDGRKTAFERGVLWTKEQNETAFKYVSGLKGKTSAECISEKIIDIAESIQPYSFSLIRACLMNLKRLWRIKLHAWRDIRHPSDGYSSQKFPGLNALEIKKTLSEMMKISSLQTELAIKPFAKYCFLLIPKTR
ncbi:MAG: hypothetical protein D3905_12285 [Candidatus Electrothrix sp. AS4_5]|nr:hypothetical protein [Candidatus Electrothrix gigas]